MSSSLENIVFITGGNQGVGYKTAKNLLLSSKEYHVILGSQDLSKGEAAARELQTVDGVKGSASAVHIDITDDKTVDAAAARVASEYGRPDSLVKNAGITSTANPPTREVFRRVLETNIVGSLSVTEAFLDLLRKAVHKPPRLVFVTSSMGSITHAADPSSPYYNPLGT
ncbi:hypothetical protein F4814DRAFT_448956 [Daldinia grandis]|nr:hypothetical protein F4814DRAFT_448956 [Daldinia grandis]